MIHHAGCLEFAPFRIAPGVSEQELLAASDRLQAELQRLPGLLGRVLLKESETQWVDIVFWRRKEDTAVMPQFVASNHAVQDYFECMVLDDSPDNAVRHFAKIKAYGNGAA